MLSNAMNQPKSTVELGYMCPRGLTGPPNSFLFKPAGNGNRTHDIQCPWIFLWVYYLKDKIYFLTKTEE